jgi:hypothetical protein
MFNYVRRNRVRVSVPVAANGNQTEMVSAYALSAGRHIALQATQPVLIGAIGDGQELGVRIAPSRALNAKHRADHASLVRDMMEAESLMFLLQ